MEEEEMQLLAAAIIVRADACLNKSPKPREDTGECGQGPD